MTNSWIVIGTGKDQRVELVSKTGTKGVLPKGSYLTIIDDEDEALFILCVEDSYVQYPYSPSPLIVDMDLDGINADLKGQNHIFARKVRDLHRRDDGLINTPQLRSIARRSNQNELDLAMDIKSEKQKPGPEVFLATVYDNENQVLMDDNQIPLYTYLKDDFIFYQTLVVGKTGSGKTVATKYLAQYFIEKNQNAGSVLAINVKDVDFLKMYEASDDVTDSIKKEWAVLGKEAHPVKNFRVYYPANIEISPSKGINSEMTTPVTLDVVSIEPEALTGLLQSITDIGAQYLPDIFRYWRAYETKNVQNNKIKSIRFKSFVDWFNDIHAESEDRERKDHFDTENLRGEPGYVKLASGTAENVLRCLKKAEIYFDNEDATILTADDILSPGMMSVIDIEDEKAKTFGSVILRHLLHQIVKKNSGMTRNPILIIIDEVHQFYNTESSKEALGDLDTICRQGRSQKIGVIFSSQTPSDIPKGLINVINTKLFFKSDVGTIKAHGIVVSDSEMQNLDAGYAIVNVHGMTQLKMVKFPLAYAGVMKTQGDY